MQNDNFFVPVANTKPYFKAAFEGFAGTGKTYTAAKIAVGIHKRIGSKKPEVKMAYFGCYLQLSI